MPIDILTFMLNKKKNNKIRTTIVDKKFSISTATYHMNY